jgi:hypothetical protein
VRRAVASLVAAALVTGVIASNAGASPGPRTTKPSSRFCAVFSDYYAASLGIGIGSGFA